MQSFNTSILIENPLEGNEIPMSKCLKIGKISDTEAGLFHTNSTNRLHNTLQYQNICIITFDFLESTYTYKPTFFIETP
jgi:hypothetical protein